MPLCKKRLECYKFNIDHDMCHNPQNYICYAPISPQTDEAKDSARPPGSIADYVDSIVGPIEGHAQSIFANDKPLYEELLRIAIRLRQIIT